jgi:hypothetical protein
VIVSVNVPLPCFLDVVTVKVEVVVAGFGPNDAVALDGSPAALRDTLPAKPLRALIVTA